ncbi:MAG: TonB family protein [Nitrospirae bacterium]|nr:TonB family protein [Nitrospirota bacterium]
MPPPIHDNSDALFRRLLTISVAIYFCFAILVVMIPYKPDLKKISIQPQRIVKLTEIPLKVQTPAATPAKIREKQRNLEEQKRREEELKKAAAAKNAEMEKKKLEEAQRLAEERKRREDERIKAEEIRRAEEERKRAEEEQRLAKERNKEIAKNSGILKAMQGRGRSNNLTNTEEINDVITQSQVKLLKGSQQAGATAGKPVLKGSGGIGSVSAGVEKGQPGRLSGQRTITAGEISPSGKGAASPFSKSTLLQTRSQASVKDVIKSHRGSLDFAYRKALRSDPTLKGIISIEFTLAPDGTIINARIVSSTVGDPEFEEDVLKRVKTWKFPAYPDSGNTIVTYPIEFSPA